MSGWLQRLFVGPRRLRQHAEAEIWFYAELEAKRRRRSTVDQLRAEEAQVTAELVASAKALASLYPGPLEDHATE